MPSDTHDTHDQGDREANNEIASTANVDQRLPRTAIAVAVVSVIVIIGVVVALVSREDDAPGEPAMIVESVDYSEGVRDDFLSIAERSERATWLVEYDYRRDGRAGSVLSDQSMEVNRPPDHLSIGLGGVSGTIDGIDVACTSTLGEVRCDPNQPVSASGPDGDEVDYRMALLSELTKDPSNGYAVGRLADETIGGEHAICFRLVRRGAKTYTEFGESAERCFAHDGIPLRTTIDRGSAVDSWIAVSVERTVSKETLVELAAPLDHPTVSAPTLYSPSASSTTTTTTTTTPSDAPQPTSTMIR